MKVQRQLMDVVANKNKPVAPDTDHRFGAILDNHNLESREAARQTNLERRPDGNRRTSDNIHTIGSTNEEREAFVRDLTPVTQAEETQAPAEQPATEEEIVEETAAYYGYAANYAYQADTALDLTEGLFYQKLAIESVEEVATPEYLAVETDTTVQEAPELTPELELPAEGELETPQEGITAEALIAETLDMSEDDALALLEKLATPTKDYATHLAEPVYQRQVVQTYYNVESPVELLSIEQAPETLAKLGEAVKNNYIVTEPDTQVVTEELPTEVPTVTDIETEQPQGELLDDSEADPNLATHTPTVATEASVELPQTAPTNSFEQALDKSIFDQIKGQVKLTELGAGSTEIRIALTPESLGEVQARILTQNGVITAQFVAMNQRVREIIESNMAQLKEELEEKGIQIGELSVSVQQDSADPQQAFEQEQQKSTNRINDIINNIAAEFDNPEETILEDGVTVSVRI